MSNEVTGKQVNTPHDKGYKKSLSQPREFLHFLRKYVRADWAQDLQESQLRLADKEYIDKDYEGREADLVYEVTRADGEKIIIFILQELQSTVDFTMIFRILMYIVSVLMRYFTNTDKSVRERKDFKLPAVVPIVFYNGRESWTAVRRLQDYQEGSELFGSHILNLEYYLVNLSDIEQEYILSTNTVLDNIMYCDQLRNKVALAEVIRAAYARTRDFEAQEKEEFENWVEHILLPICGYDAEVAWEILQHARNGEDNMAFEYNIQRIFREEREQAIAEGHAEGHAEGRAEGHAEGHAEGRAEGLAEGHAEGLAEAILTLLEDLGEIPKELREKIRTQTDNDVLTKWLKMAARSESIEAFRKVMLL